MSSLFNRLKLDHVSGRFIEVVGRYDGFHAYLDAPDEVAFLRLRHRHIFKWNAVIEVFHDDRELEFFMVQDNVYKTIIPFLRTKYNLGSCEQQAEIILEGLVNIYGPDRRYDVYVSEDGENAGGITWDP